MSNRKCPFLVPRSTPLLLLSGPKFQEGFAVPRHGFGGPCGFVYVAAWGHVGVLGCAWLGKWREREVRGQGSAPSPLEAVG